MLFEKARKLKLENGDQNEDNDLDENDENGKNLNSKTDKKSTFLAIAASKNTTNANAATNSATGNIKNSKKKTGGTVFQPGSADGINENDKDTCKDQIIPKKSVTPNDFKLENSTHFSVFHKAVASARGVPKLSSIIDQTEKDWNKFREEKGLQDFFARNRSTGVLEQRNALLKLQTTQNASRNASPTKNLSRTEANAANSSAGASSTAAAGMSAGQLKKYVV